MNYIKNNNKKAIAAFMMAGALAVGFTACSKDDLVKEPEPTTLNKPMLGDDMTNKEFLNNWENCHTVKIAGIQDEVNCPWYGASAQNIPDMIRFDIKKGNGWEMAFCELNDPNAMRTRMFGLYKAFIPKIKLIVHNELSGWYTQLKAYNDLCERQQPVASLANNSSIKVYDKHSNFFLTRTLKMLEKVR